MADAARQSIDEMFREERYGNPHTRARDARRSQRRNTRAQQQARRGPYQDEDLPELQQQLPQLKQRNAAAKGYAHVRSATVTFAIWAWATALWLKAQLPLAAIFLVFFGVAFSVAESTILSSLASLASSISSLFGYDVEEIAAGVMFICYLAIIAIGWGTLAAMWLSYTTALLHPFSGEGAFWKTLSFLVAFVGYATPLLNLLPWFYLYSFFVLRYPK